MTVLGVDGAVDAIELPLSLPSECHCNDRRNPWACGVGMSGEKKPFFLSAVLGMEKILSSRE
jgi:hypothetical protein